MQCQRNRPISSNPSRFFQPISPDGVLIDEEGKKNAIFPIWGPAACIHTHLSESPRLDLTQQESHGSKQRGVTLAKVTFRGPAAKWELQTNFSNFPMHFVSLPNTHLSSEQETYLSKLWSFHSDRKRIRDIMGRCKDFVMAKTGLSEKCVKRVVCRIWGKICFQKRSNVFPTAKLKTSPSVLQ